MAGLRHLLLALGLILAMTACKEGTAIISGQDVVSSLPWMGPEVARYRLLDGKKVVGTGTLTLELQGETVAFAQSFEFPQPGITDDVLVEADVDNLRPRSLQRLIRGPEGDRSCQASYVGGIAVVEQRSEKDQRTDRLDVPVRAYDSWSDVFLWRSLPFAPGYAATYTDVLTCTLAKPQVISVALEVKGKETVSVPAGTFSTWRLEIRSGGRTQKAWYADDAARTLVRYDNGDLVFELEAAE